MRRDGNARRAPLLLGILLGLLALAAGALAAGAFLPEWRADEPLDEEVYRERYAALAARAGFRVEPGEPRVRLATRGFKSWMLTDPTGIRIEVFHKVRGTEAGENGTFTVDFSADGRPQALAWWGASGFSMFRIPSIEESFRLMESLAPLLLHPGESLGEIRRGRYQTVPRLLAPVEGGARPHHLFALGFGNAQMGRRTGSLTKETVRAADASMARAISLFWLSILGTVLALGLFLALLLKARLSVANGALLALVSLATLRPVPDLLLGTRGSALWATGQVVLCVFLLWSSAESLLRSTGPDFTTSLDALRARRLGPRGGRSLLLGFAFGTGVAGLRLGLYSLAEALPGIQPEEPSVSLPVFGSFSSPVADGVLLAALVALALAFSLRILPARWAPRAAALALGLLVPPVAFHPFAAQAVAGTVFAGVLVYVCQRHGLTALLAATIVSVAAPLALLSSLHAGWLAGGLAGTAGLCAAVLLLGFAGLSRSPAGEVERLTPPAFVRRLDEERRLKHEMTLLARMQKGLLPRKLPQLAGYEIAPRSVLASEAGGDLYDFLQDDDGYLWIAAGDVAGHGYSCAVTQAMTKAALASLAGHGRTPAEVLQRIDKVLRTAGPTRTFATLALLRLHPETGEAVLANAGHPYPLLAADGGVTELALSGRLPLGVGPPRRYEDVPIVLPPGSVLVFFSDGLVEAVDGKGATYGYEHALGVLRRVRQRTAEKILEAFFADWRRHLRAAQALDDTTLVVLKRLDGRS